MNEQEFYSVGPRGVIVRVRAKPHAREDAVLGIRAGELVVSVRAPAEKGKANAEIIRVLARALGLPQGSVLLKSGAGSPHKVLLVSLDALDAVRALASG